MKTLPKVMLGVGLFASGFLFQTENAKADMLESSYKDVQLFPELAGDQKVLELPKGGFLHGEAIVEEADGTTIHYNSETDVNSISIDQARMAVYDLQQKNDKWLFGNPILTRGTQPPTSTTSLKYNASYSSASFSGSGMRFAGYYFKTTGTTGTGLRYWSNKSGGAAGSSYAAWQSYYDKGYSGGASVMAAGGTTKVTGVTTYFTNNPKSGTTYTVKNTE
ncbi:hypothetical protein [Enterococcus asini]|uniref:hypothetical protein n=1 Tax=Enterococcus asini TaxID=57732 RepID=UPI00266C49EF|nr:hypothetical protein [Enterococcus asini]